MKGFEKAAEALVVLVLIAGIGGCSYNRFVSQEEEIKTQWAQVQNQLQRRSDLIPNLVATVKGFAQQEKDVFGKIAESRARLAGAKADTLEAADQVEKSNAQLAGAKTPQATIEAANQQSAALARLLVVVENYPELKSNENFKNLQDSLETAENRISTERMRYNEKVREYNISRRSFPSNITAGIFGFKDSYPLFEAPADAKKVPKVDFGKG
jgi:LemA protein